MNSPTSPSHGTPLGATPATGGPAFPCEGGPDSGLHAAPGMTLRDYFAGQALTAQVEAAYLQEWANESAEWRLAVAKGAYRFADAMIAARNA